MNCPRTAWVLSALLSLLVLMGCAGDDRGEIDSRPPGSARACVPGELTRPDGSCQPAGLPPDMPCPPGERALPDGSCQPAGVPPEACAAGRFVPDNRGGCEAILPEQACPPGEMAVPGERACREVSPCGEGPWGDIPTEATTEHVDQAYPGSDSDGSRERPWKTVGAGVQSALPGAIVAVAAGRYEEDVLLASKPVRLWGRCPAQTEVVGRGVQNGAITVSREGASGSVVRGLAVTGSRAAGIAVQVARSVVIEEVWVHDAGTYGVAVLERAGVTLRGVLLEQNHDTGLIVEGSEATVEATVVRATQPDNRGGFGRGIGVHADRETGERGKLSLTASLVEENHYIGVSLWGSEATVEATVVRATQPDDTGESGKGISVQEDPEAGGRGKLSLTASLVDQNHEIGVFVGASDATIEATVVRATQPNGAGGLGWGIAVQQNPATGQGGDLSLTASLLEENHEVGMYIVGSKATIEATVVRETQPNSAGELGRGIGVQQNTMTGQGGNLSLTASLVEANYDHGVFALGSEATIEATVVRATRSDREGAFGRGIAVEPMRSTGERGRLSLTASLVEENHDHGVFIEASEATVVATVVRATQPNGAGAFGRGIGVQSNLERSEPGRLSLTASLVEENHDVGVFVAGSEVTIEATAVRATKRAPAGQEFGDGFLVLDERGRSSAAITATESTGNDRAGVMYVGSTGELSGVWSSHNRFGLVLQHGASGAQPTLGEDNLFEVNTESDELVGGDLPVPTAALPLP